MKICKKIILIFVLVFSISIFNVNALTDYTIAGFNIDVKVNEDNTFDIIEIITANFYFPKHGIYRTIPLKNEVIREDGTSYKNTARISKVKVNDVFLTSRKNGNYIIKIGSPTKTLTGSKVYEIRYHYNIGNDKNKDFDELYYNLIGTTWDTTISNISFSITMPKELDEAEIGFSAGKYGESGTSDVSYEVDGNVITGTFDQTLNPGEGLTVRLELPDGYFVKQTFNMEYITYILPFIFLGIAILIWYLYGKDEKTIETIEFYPPKGKNSLEVGFLYKGKAGKEDVTSLLVYLANKGYIKIKEDKKEEFRIIKVKAYKGKNALEKEFLDGLFKNSKKDKKGREFVTNDDLYASFYNTMHSILKNINSEKNNNKIFEKISNLKYIDIIMYILTIIILLFLLLVKYGIIISLIISSLIGIGLFFLVSKISEPCLSYEVIVVGGVIVLILIPAICILSGITPMIRAIIAIIYDHPFLAFLDLICAVGILIFYKLMPKRNKYGTKVLGKIEGFRTFLETAEKEKLETMVEDNPTYFYDILPFTYVLGVSSTWISKFETINMKAPDWYDGKDVFDVVTINNFIDNTMDSATRSMSSSYSSSSSGSSDSGFSGGGVSGGGSGGGGGGSW